MRMASFTAKGLGGAVVVWLTYINHTFSPLIWVLLGLIFIDLILNVHKEGQQLTKIGSMVAALGIPAYVAQNLSSPHIGKYIVAMLCLVYIQLVFTQLKKKIQTFRLFTPAEKVTAEQLLKELEQQGILKAKQEQASSLKDSVSQASTGNASDPTKGA